MSVVSVAARFPVRIAGVNDPGGWDTHGSNFKLLRAKLPIYDQAVYALLTDLHDRGLDQDVAVVIWGEFGRTPKIGDSTPDGRGHWHDSGLCPDGRRRPARWAGRRRDRRPRRAAPLPAATPPQDVLATLYHVLGIDPASDRRCRLQRPAAVSTGSSGEDRGAGLKWSPAVSCCQGSC